MYAGIHVLNTCACAVCARARLHAGTYSSGVYVSLSLSIYIYIHIYIYIYIHREREGYILYYIYRERERDRYIEHVSAARFIASRFRRRGAALPLLPLYIPCRSDPISRLRSPQGSRPSWFMLTNLERKLARSVWPEPSSFRSRPGPPM